MEARQQGRLAKLTQLAQRDKRLTLAIGVVALLSVFAVASVMPHDGASAQSAATVLPPAATATAPLVMTMTPTARPARLDRSAYLTATPVAPASKTSRQTAGRTHLATPTAVPATPIAPATPVPAATPSEAQTPLNLSDPPVDTASSTTPWWQSLFDISWKLALVIALIYLAMRGLLALKNAGFTPNGKGGRAKANQQFFEEIEEIRISPQHTLHAVRAGNRIILLARSGATLRPLSEVEVGDLEADTLANLASDSFGRHLLGAWAGALPSAGEQGDEAGSDGVATLATLSEQSTSHLAGDKGVVEASWVMVETDTPAEAREENTPLPLKQGKARPSDRPAPPEPMDDETLREMLWFAERHGVSAAAERYGLTRQRVTALRSRYEKRAAARRREAERVAQGEQPAAAHAAPERTTWGSMPLAMEEPMHPRGNAANHSFTPFAATRANLIAGTYGKSDGPAKGDTMPIPLVGRKRADTASGSDPEADVAATAIAQALAARFGVRIQQGKK